MKKKNKTFFTKYQQIKFTKKRKYIVTTWHAYQKFKINLTFENQSTYYQNEKKSHNYLNRWRKTFDKVQHSFLIKTLNKLKEAGNIPKLIKTI